MELHYNLIDKAYKAEKFRRGEWDDEPDMADWEYRGIKCLILRNFRYGHLCGYCEYKHGKDNYDKFDVHGGITFDDNLSTLSDYKLSDSFYIGFDCNHSGDSSPIIGEDRSEYWPIYKTISFVQQQCESLVDQILALEEK